MNRREQDGFFLPSAHLCVAFVYARNNNVDQKMDGYKSTAKVRVTANLS